MLVEPNELQEEGKFYLERMDRPQAFHCGAADAGGDLQVSVGDGGGRAGGSMETTAHLEFESVERFSGEIAKVRDELDKVSDGHEVFVVCETEAEVERLEELFKTSKLMGGVEALRPCTRRMASCASMLGCILSSGIWRLGFGSCRSRWCW